MFIAPTKCLLLQDRRIMISNTNVTSTYDNSILDVFEDLAVYPDSDVILARRFNGNFLHLMSVYRPSPQRAVIWENRGNWTIENGLQMSTFDVSSTRRRNLQQTALKSCIVVLWTCIRPPCKETHLSNDTRSKIFHLQAFNICTSIISLFHSNKNVEKKIMP